VAVASQAEIQKSVRAALKEGRHDEAKVTLAAALDRWPDAYWMLMLHAEVLKHPATSRRHSHNCVQFTKDFRTSTGQHKE